MARESRYLQSYLPRAMFLPSHVRLLTTGNAFIHIDNSCKGFLSYGSMCLHASKCWLRARDATNLQGPQ